tara:strand:+ start:217 stop:810 length:594 start_codon:yes stop_codon:yes gene_type:complete
MRARMAMAYSKISYEHREILLKNRPKDLYRISKKGTVPVLQLVDGTVIDESVDIMKWCMKQNDLDGWFRDNYASQNRFIKNNDTEFKYWLDRYKYHIRYIENSYEKYQKEVEAFLIKYNLILQEKRFLMGKKLSLVDVALMPFIRQAAHVDIGWFDQNFPALSDWLEKLKVSPLFLSIMKKYDIWDDNGEGVIVKWQ